MPAWRDGARSPLPPLDPDAPAPVFQLTPPRLVGSRSFWSSVELSATALRRALMGAIFAADAPRSVMARKLAGVSIMASCHFVDAEWSALWKSGRTVAGREFLSLVSLLFGIPPGVASVRVLESCTGAKFDARAALEIAAAVDGWFERGAPPNEGRRA
ncbi:MAG TPA: hypothetical protein VIF88_11300 [Methylocystis sp.]